jgi:hypothetical protein
MKLSEYWLPGYQHNPEIEEETGNFLNYWLKGISVSIDAIPLERIESGTFDPNLSFSGDAVVYWKVVAYIVRGFPPRLYQKSEDEWVGLFVETADGFMVSSSLTRDTPSFHKDYRDALAEFEELKGSL